MVIFQSIIYRADLMANREVVYVFGDNDKRSGMGGQAAQMRGEPNAYGIRTKRAPGTNPEDFYYDDDYEANMVKISEDIDVLELLFRQGRTIIIPMDGIGTNRAQMAMRCPKTFYEMKSLLSSIFRKKNIMDW